MEKNYHTIREKNDFCNSSCSGSHTNKNRKVELESDKIRDAALIRNGIIVYRIEWKNINTKNGKEYMKNEIDKFLKFIEGI